MILNTRFQRTALVAALLTALNMTAPVSAAEQAPAPVANPAAEPAANPAAEPASAAAQLPDVSKMDEQQKVVYLAHMGRGVMGYIDAARNSLESKQNDAARQQLIEAQNLLKQLKADSKDDLIPIYMQIGFTEQFEMTDEVKQKLEGVDQHVIKGDHDKVVEVLKSTGAKMAYTHVEMPLAETTSQVDVALKAIADQTWDKASQALTAAGEGLQIDTVSVGETG
jgi:hypothetical protein